jgi:hypothetical protein
MRTFREKPMRKIIARANGLGVDFDFETAFRMGCLFDLGEKITIERARLDEVGLPTLIHDDLMAKIEDEFRMLAAKYDANALIQASKPVSNSS